MDAPFGVCLDLDTSIPEVPIYSIYFELSNVLHLRLLSSSMYLCFLDLKGHFPQGTFL
jgi:hypothetical protein